MSCRCRAAAHLFGVPFPRHFCHQPPRLTGHAQTNQDVRPEIAVVTEAHVSSQPLDLDERDAPEGPAERCGGLGSELSVTPSTSVVNGTAKFSPSAGRPGLLPAIGYRLTAIG
jgi:hypothetical protein